MAKTTTMMMILLPLGKNKRPLKAKKPPEIKIKAQRKKIKRLRKRGTNFYITRI